MKHPFVFVLALILVLGGGMTPLFSGEPETAIMGFDEKIAAVNGVGITRRDFMWAYSSEEQRQISSGNMLTQEEIRDMKQSVFDNLINREILYQESLNKKIIVPDQRIEDEFARVQASMMSEIDLASLERELGMDETHIKDEFRRVFAIEALFARELSGDAEPVTEKQTREFYEANPDMFLLRGPVFVRHILIKVAPSADDATKAEARKRIEAVLAKASAGEDFGELAVRYSEGPSAVRGGIVGWVKPDRTVKAFEDAAFSLEVGEVSGIVETPYGYHVLKVTEKEPDQMFVYEEIQDKLADHLRELKEIEKQQAYIEKLKKTAVIEQYMDILDIN